MVFSALTCMVGMAVGAACVNAPFKDGDRVVFWGDSITHGGTYTKMLADFYLTRYPDRTVRFYNAGVSGDNAGDAFSRFEEDVLRRNPTVVTFMFGMNDSWRDNYCPDLLADPKHRARLPAIERACFVKYTNNMTRLVHAVSSKCPDARKIFLTPTPTDDTCKPKPDGMKPVPPLTGTVGALGRFADFEKSFADVFNAGVIDFLGPFTNLVAREQEKNPAFTLLRRDRVHPIAPGHLYMTYEFLRQQGVDGTVSDVTIRAKDGRAVDKALKNATVQDVVWDKKKARLSFKVLEKALPWPIQSDALAALDLAPIVNELNREMLTVYQLPEGSYVLSIDGTEVGRHSAAELAKGINLARNGRTPQFRQAAMLEAKNAERCQIERKQLRMFAASRWMLRKRKVDPDDFAAVQKYYEGLDEKERKGYFESFLSAYLAYYKNKSAIEADQESRYDELLKLRKPIAHEYVIEKVCPEEAEGPVVRFGIVADLHFADKPSDDRGRGGVRSYRESGRKLTEAVSVFNACALDFVIELGDLKDFSKDRTATLRCLDEIERIFAGFKGPRYHVLGNHDFDCLTPGEFLSHVTNAGSQMARGYYSFCVKGVKFIVLDACYDSGLRHYSRQNPWDDANVPQDELLWLKKELASTEGHAVVFCHQRLDTAAADCHAVRNAAEVRSVLEFSKKVSAVVTGHDHNGGFAVVGGIPYYSMLAMVCGAGVGANSYAEMCLYADGSVSVTGWHGARSLKRRCERD